MTARLKLEYAVLIALTGSLSCHGSSVVRSSSPGPGGARRGRRALGGGGGGNLGLDTGLQYVPLPTRDCRTTVTRAVRTVAPPEQGRDSSQSLSLSELRAAAASHGRRPALALPLCRSDSKAAPPRPETRSSAGRRQRL